MISQTASSQSPDQDLFKFIGKTGDIISVLCTTKGLGSDLDSVLDIHDSNGNLIAYNDQNGLAPGEYAQGDSFIQMVLPADGTYYIVVYDYNKGVGAFSASYRLHTKLP